MAAAIAEAWPWGDAHVESIRRALWRLGKRGITVEAAQVTEALRYAQASGWRRRGANRAATAATFVRDQVHVELLEQRAKARAAAAPSPAAAAIPPPRSPAEVADELAKLRQLRGRKA